jgi:hypothetical protein
MVVVVLAIEPTTNIQACAWVSSETEVGAALI